MNELASSRLAEVGTMPASLEEKLIWLTRFGTPVVRHMGDGWYSAIDMHVSSQGATFNVASDFKRPSPAAAVDECIDRMLKTLADLGAKP